MQTYEMAWWCSKFLRHLTKECCTVRLWMLGKKQLPMVARFDRVHGMVKLRPCNAYGGAGFSLG